jgi:hypothetical protein
MADLPEAREGDDRRAEALHRGRLEHNRARQSPFRVNAERQASRPGFDEFGPSD